MDDFMITAEALDVYIGYDGDLDGITRCNKPGEWEALGGVASIIDRIVQNLAIVHNGYASEKLKAAVAADLTTYCDAPETIERLESYARNRADRETRETPTKTQEWIDYTTPRKKTDM